MESSRPPSPLVNYFYFGIYFLALLLMAASSIFAKQNLSGSRIFFFLYAVGQAALETGALIFAATYIRKFAGKIAFYFFIGATFLLLIFHFFDFLMDRILDLSIWETLSFVFDEDLHNFIYLLDASGVPLFIWIAGFSLFAMLPVLGALFYRFSERLTDRRPLPFRPEHFLLCFFCIPAALAFWDFSASRIIHPDAYTAFLQSLPWKMTLLEPETSTLSLKGHFKQEPLESSVREAIAQDATALAQKPNIYLIITESLRRDMITEEIAPHLFSFSRQVAHFPYTLSNANGTNLSWFSIFHSQYAYHWNRWKKKNWTMGSPALALLKKWGYQIHVYTSAQLGYYDLEPLIFGENQNLLHANLKFHHPPPLKAADGDASALEQLQKDLAANPHLHQGQIFILFWDSTHFDYSWPTNWTPKFVPFASEFAYFKAFYSKHLIDQIKNRYRNAVHYIDSLFGKFIASLPHPEEAIVVFTGDHGEEFFEQGHLFHNSHLTQEQTHVPLLMKFGSVQPTTERQITSQIDIFPTILDYLSGKTFAFLEGQSLFRDSSWPYAVVSRFNASRSPYEIYLHNGTYKFTLQFSNRDAIYTSDRLHIRSIRKANDQVVAASTFQNLPEWIEKEFGAALERLTDSN